MLEAVCVSDRKSCLGGGVDAGLGVLSVSSIYRSFYSHVGYGFSGCRGAAYGGYLWGG